MNQTQPNRAPSRLSASVAAIFVLVVIAFGVLVAKTINITPPEASIQAVMVDDLYRKMLGIAAAIFLLVEGGLVYAVIKFRRSPTRQGEGEQIYENNQLELAWTVMPALIVIWLAVTSAGIVTKLHQTPSDAMPVQVIAEQFNWTFEYPQYGFSSPELHVARGTPVALELSSKDVIHSFWVPAFRIKQDAFPGRTTRTTFTAVMTGEFPVVCAELCGPGHSLMRSKVVVHDPADFQSWLEEASK